MFDQTKWDQIMEDIISIDRQPLDSNMAVRELKSLMQTTEDENMLSALCMAIVALPYYYQRAERRYVDRKSGKFLTYCSKCGKVISHRNDFCPWCGIKFKYEYPRRKKVRYGARRGKVSRSNMSALKQIIREEKQ